MRKISRFHFYLIGYIAVLLMAVAGCSSETIPVLRKPPSLPAAFTAQINFSMNALSGSAILTRPDDTGLQLDFLMPETLSGYNITISDGDISVSFGDVTAALGETLPDGALIAVLDDALTFSAVPEQIEAVPQGENWELTGTLPKASGDFRLTVSGDGLPISLIAEHAEISVNFLQVTLS